MRRDCRKPQIVKTGLSLLLLLASAALATVSGAVEEDVAVVSGEKAPINLTAYVTCFEDLEKALSVQDILSASFRERFEKIGGDRIRWPGRNANYWLRLKLRYEPGGEKTEPLERILFLDAPAAGHITYFESDGKEIFREFHTGAFVPFAQREIEAQGYAFTVRLEPGKTKWILFRIASRQALVFPLTLWAQKTFLHEQRRLEHVEIFYFGALFLMILYNFVLCIFTRSRKYLYCFMCLLGVMLLGASFCGIGFEYLWPNVPACNAYAMPYACLLVCLFGSLFVRDVLETREKLPGFEEVFLAMVLISGVGAGCLLFPFAGVGLTSRAAVSALVVLAFLGLFSSFASARRGLPTGWIYLLAWGAVTVGSMLIASSVFGLLMAPVFAMRAWMATSLFASGFFFLALVHGINAERSIKTKAQEIAIQNLQKYQTLHDECIEGIFLADPAGEVFSGNPALADMLGYLSVEQMMSGDRPTLDQFFATVALLNAFQERMERDGKVVGFDTQVQKRDGTLFWASVSAKAIRDPRDALLHIEGILVDQQERKAMESAKRDMATARTEILSKSEFLWNMSHEIRTALHGMLGMTRLLRDTPLNVRQENYIDKIQNSGNALLRTLNDVLAYSKLEIGKMRLEPVTFNLEHLVDDCLAMYSVKASEKSLPLVSSLHPLTPMILEADAVRIRQVIGNLLGNAFKFTERGEVLLRVQPLDVVSQPAVKARCEIRFQVRDTGIGLSQQQQGLLFQDPGQPDSVGGGADNGTRLGLKICKRLVAMMDGKIGVESRPGQGSSFWFTVPCLVKDLAPPEHALFSAHLHGRRILIVDPHETFQTCTREILLAWGIDVVTAENSFQAREQIENALRSIDWVLVDRCLRDEDALAFSKFVTRDGVKGAPRVLFACDVHHMPGEAERSEAGISGVVGKPLSLRKLREVLALSLGQELPACLEPPASEATGRTGVRRVLVVSGDPAEQLLLRGLLAKLDTVAVIAKDGLMAVHTFFSSNMPLDLVLVDSALPEGDGYNAVKQIRQKERTQARSPCMIVVLADRAAQLHEQKATEVGIDAFLRKPVLLSELEETLADLAKNRKRKESASL